ncbi:RIO1 family regulatory kinase/ATPase [Alteromonas sp. C1M14]|uniref:RIO1 family regulatory kinase/ATPase domain-containing protein n=1 Tax=Alteromonas sp. C1M14 TaxID=2841567 RepID=UPI001C09A9E8|nr:RIO1 family regulatory kinase/ATPase [Alteromonas sp. C1M14]MBU2978117.1 serine/threonine protein kinase [Alteromonas sp. C1M14]
MNKQQAEAWLSKAMQSTCDVISVELLHAGRWANARVYLVKGAQADFIIKDFSHCPWWVRRTLAKSFVNREVRALSMLSNSPYFDVQCYRLSDIAFAYPYVEGESLKAIRDREATLPATFFTEMERMIGAMHRIGLSHLDLRNFGNVLCTKEGKPHIIDYQSAVRLSHFPKAIQRFMRGADITGAYKAWQQIGQTAIPTAKAQLYEGYNKKRKFWVFRGYPVARLQLRLQTVAAQFLSLDIIRNLIDKL